MMTYPSNQQPSVEELAYMQELLNNVYEIGAALIELYNNPTKH